MATNRLGRYTLLDELAQGGMSRVFVAQKDGADGICVLKQLLVELKTHEVAAKRFHREAHIASFLDHPHIARLLDAGFEDDSFCMAMEFIAGSDLESILRALDGRMMPWQLAVAIGLFVLEALAYAHDAVDSEQKPLQVVHRDIAPRNVMVGFRGEVKLIDFGLARGKLGKFETEPGIIVGTLRYLSPEQARSEEVDRRSDIYSLAVVLHELLTGQKVVQEKTPLAALREIMNQSPPLMRTINATVPTGIEFAIARALEKKPEDRFQTAGEFRDALLDVVGTAHARAQVPALGELVRELFPEGERKAAVLNELGRHRFASVWGRSESIRGTISEGATRDYSGDALSPWQPMETIESVAAQLDVETSPGIVPRKSGERPGVRMGGSADPRRPGMSDLLRGPGSDPTLDVVEADTVRVPIPKIDSKLNALRDPYPTLPQGPPLLKPRPPDDAGAETDLDVTLDPDKRTQRMTLQPTLQPKIELEPSAIATLEAPSREVFSAGIHAVDVEASEDADMPPDDDTAVSAHPLVRQRERRNRMVMIGLIGAAVAIVLFFAIAFDRCG